MRLGVLDIGSNTVHLLVVDAHWGAHPTPMSSTKATLRLAEKIEPSGRLSQAGEDALVDAVEEFTKIARSSGCSEVMAFATSAVRDASNTDTVLEHVKRATGVDVEVLAGADESRLTALAVRRWYGWSVGRVLNIDIGGGSLEMSNGVDEEPDVALSLPLGAGRITREWLPEDPPGRRRVAMLRDWLDAEIAPAATRLAAVGTPDLVAGTSKTMRTLARLTGAAPSSAGPRVKRTLTASGLRQLIAFISRMTEADRKELEGLSSDRAGQIVAGALIAEAAMRSMKVEALDICPWALREGVILHYLDTQAGFTPENSVKGPK